MILRKGAFICVDPAGRGQWVLTPMEIGFLGNTGPDPLENHKPTTPAGNVGPSFARQQNGASLARWWWHTFSSVALGYSLSSSTKETNPRCQCWFGLPSEKKTFWISACKRSNQNDFVYGELGRVPLQNMFFHSGITFLFIILEA